jgi:hypothetical protein
MPVVAGAWLVTAALVRLTHTPLAVFWAALALGVAGVAVFTLLKGRAPAVTDAAAAKLDADAGLAGELRSAHWFASNAASDPWTSFHLERASDHVESVSWPTVYPPVKGARAWAGSAVLAVAAIAIVMSSAWPSAKGNAVAGTARGAAAGKDTTGLPTDLQKQIDELLRAIESGAIPMDAARTKLAEMRDALANLDPKTPAARAKAAAEQMKNAGKDAKDDAGKSLAERAEQAAAKPFLPQDMKWSMEDLASKLKYAGKPKDTTGEEDQTEKAASASGQKGSDAQANKDGEAGTQMTRTTSADAQSSQMMASTMSPMPGERGPNGAQEKKNLGAPLDLTGALRKETIEADTDSQGSNVLAEMRKKSEQQHSTLGFSRVAPLAAYDKSHAVAPPRPNDSVRPLVKLYFIRK